MRLKYRVGTMPGPWPTGPGGVDQLWRLVDLCETSGIDSLWFSDRLSSPLHVLEPLTTMAAVAARTRRLKFGPSVIVAPFRSPVLLAREMGYNVVESIKWFGSRDQINHVHLRNVLMTTPRQKYVETFIDAGDNDMMACLRALHATGYPRLLHPDHVPELPGEPHQHGGWGYTVGQIKAMMRQL